jgi:CheY-like chemotaxis protein
VDLHEVVAESLRLNQGFAVRFLVQLRAAGELPSATVRGDRKRLMQIMTNLLSNAAKFSPPQGAVEVAMRADGERVRVEIGDRGPGIPEKFRSRIFGRFAQADSSDSRIKGGTGLGLAICKRLIEMMQGEVGFEDRAGGGTTFWFELPLLKAEEADDSVLRVLLTDHDTVAAEYLVMVLEKAGYRVDTAPDADTSRALLARWHYGLWLLSYNLRGGSPLALLAEMRHRLADTRIIMLMSLRTDQDGVADPARHGIVGWVMKNEPRASVLAAVKQALGDRALPHQA